MKKVFILILITLLIFTSCSDVNITDDTYNAKDISDTEDVYDTENVSESKIIINSEGVIAYGDRSSTLQLNTEYFFEDTDDTLLNYFKYNIPESVVKSDEMLRSIEFNGKEVSLEYIESRYRCGIDDSRNSMYDAYDVYKSDDGEIYYIRADNKIVYYTNYNYIERITDVDVVEAKELADEYLSELFGDDANKYTYTHFINVGLTYAVCYAKMNGEVKTTDMVTMFFNSNDELVSFSASDRGRYDDISTSISEQIISSCNTRLAIALDTVDVSSEWMLSDYILGEYNGELYLFTSMKDSNQSIYFFIPVESK